MLKPIIYNLEEFAQATVDFISTDTELVEIFKKAQEKYNESSYWTGLFTYFSRYRQNALKEAISGLENLSDPIKRMEEFKHFISEGQWKSTSANTRVFTYLIRAIPGYESNEQVLPDHYIHEVLISPLKNLINRDIDTLIGEYRLVANRAEERKKELAAILASQQRTVENIVLFDEGRETAKFAVNNPEKLVFHLAPISERSKLWQLTWYDLSGKGNILVVETELAKTLEKLKPQKLPDANSKLTLKIKLACAELAEEYLSRTQVFVDPPLENLINLASAFVLKKQFESYKLYWYDSLGQCYSVPLQEENLLTQWLAEKRQLLAEDLSRLKAYLQHIRVRREVDATKHSNIGQVLQKNHGITLVTHNNLAKIPPFRLIAGTYFLTREPDIFTGVWTLYQKQKGMKSLQKINTDSWENFHDLLIEQGNLSAEQLISTTGEDYDVCLKLDNPIPEPNKLYMSITKIKMGEEEKEALQYSVMDPTGKQITHTITDKELKQKFEAPLTSEQLFSLRANILALVAKRGHIVSVADKIRDRIKKSIASENVLLKKDSLEPTSSSPPLIGKLKPEQGAALLGLFGSSSPKSKPSPTNNDQVYAMRS